MWKEICPKKNSELMYLIHKPCYPHFLKSVIAKMTLSLLSNWSKMLCTCQSRQMFISLSLTVYKTDFYRFLFIDFYLNKSKRKFIERFCSQNLCRLTGPVWQCLPECLLLLCGHHSNSSQIIIYSVLRVTCNIAKESFCQGKKLK